MPKFNPGQVSQEAQVKEWFDHPTEGFIAFDPNTLYLDPVKHSRPIEMPEKFVGTRQPFVRTCSEPSEKNLGCGKWAGCPFKKFPYVGPGNVIMKKHGTVSMSACYDYYESTRGGRPVSQNHYGIDGWELATDRTTIDVLGRTAHVKSKKLTEESSREKTISSKPSVWQMEVGNLLPPWWPMMKKKGLKLPESAKRYPELTEE
jgi:hypothetical protein